MLEVVAAASLVALNRAMALFQKGPDRSRRLAFYSPRVSTMSHTQPQHSVFAPHTYYFRLLVAGAGIGIISAGSPPWGTLSHALIRSTWKPLTWSTRSLGSKFQPAGHLAMRRR